MTEDLRCTGLIIPDLITWPDTISEAKVVQSALKDKVKIIPLQKTPEYITGVDAAFPENNVLAVACLYRYPELSLVEETIAVTEVSFPYIPCFLSRSCLQLWQTPCFRDTWSAWPEDSTAIPGWKDAQ